MKKRKSNSPKTKKERMRLAMYLVAMAGFAIPIVFLLFRLIFGRDTPPVQRNDADYALMITQCLLGVLAIHIPMIFARGFRFDLPCLLYGLYLLFLYCSIFLGEVRSFYYRVPHWDVILHSFSSMMAGFFGTMVIAVFNRDEHATKKLSPLFIGVFSFCFALSLGALWEICEYISDSISGGNMQKFALADGTLLSGRAALNDTMKDLIVDAIGALIASVVGVLSLKKGKRWLVPSLTGRAVEKSDALAPEPAAEETVSPAESSKPPAATPAAK